MTEQQRSLLPFYSGWGNYNRALINAIASLTDEQLALRTTPQHWTIRMYVTHIVAIRAWFFHARMGEGGDDLTRFDLWALAVAEADVDPGHTAADLVEGLEKTWGLIEGTLSHLTPADLQRTIPALDQAGREFHAARVEPELKPYAQMWLDASRGTGNDDEVVRPSISYQSVIWGTLEHDIHHGSEVSTTLGVHGLPVLDLD